jgi:hypothetical protein
VDKKLPAPKGKKSLETLLRERAWEEVREKLQNEGIAIDDVEQRCWDCPEAI